MRVRFDVDDVMASCLRGKECIMVGYQATRRFPRQPSADRSFMSLLGMMPALVSLPPSCFAFGIKSSGTWSACNVHSTTHTHAHTHTCTHIHMHMHTPK